MQVPVLSGVGMAVILCITAPILHAANTATGARDSTTATNAPAAASSLVIRIDAGRNTGTIRALHGVNGGPLCLGGTVDLSKYHQALGIPSTRVHDAAWPRGDMVDVHTIFPVFEADAESPANYRFATTDEYLQAITGVGSKVMYRLGESCEVSKARYYVKQPPDFDQWTRICLGIIRHYNEGWADGMKLNIEYFEIWNEVEIGKMMWSGKKEEYYRLYGTAAKAIKARYPALKIGGPAAAGTLLMKDGTLELSKFVRGFLDYCKKESVPLDFFTWHQYALTPSGEVPVAKAMRSVLDEYGFTRTELHFNEWNYLPGGQMNPLWSRDGEQMTRFFAGIGTMHAAAYDACMLLAMQDTPVDMMNYYSGDNSFFGMFTTYGLPKKPYYSFLAFKAMVDHPIRVDLQGGKPDELHAMAGLSTNRQELAVMLCNYQSAGSRLDIELKNLPWTGPSECEVLLLDEKLNLEPIRKEPYNGQVFKVRQDLPAPGVMLMYVRQSCKKTSKR
ncbi:MAG: hypothetical protein WCN95_14210 [bacterium]